MQTDELLEFHAELTTKAREIMRAKNHDYANPELTGDPFANFKRSEVMGICSAEQGFLVRITDKICRLTTFAQAGKLEVKNEGAEDAILDVINYMIILAGYLRSKEEK